MRLSGAATGATVRVAVGTRLVTGAAAVLVTAAIWLTDFVAIDRVLDTTCATGAVSDATTGLVVVLTVLTAVVAVLVIAGLVVVLTVLTAVVAGLTTALTAGAGVATGLTTLVAAAAVEPAPGAPEDTAFETALPGATEDGGVAALGRLETLPRVTAAAAPLGTARAASSNATAAIHRTLKLQTSPTSVATLPPSGGKATYPLGWFFAIRRTARRRPDGPSVVV
jgi:hypothetical protein